MKFLLRAIAPFFVIAACYGLAQYMIRNRKDAQVAKAERPATRVVGTRLKKTQYEVLVHTYGTVQPRTESTLIPEVPGKIVEISASLRDGGFFEQDEVLLRIDRRDYETRLVVAKRNLAQAESLLEVEKARGQQAVENWKRLGKSGEPSDLALRMPQMAEAKAQVEAAKAEVEKADRDLARTDIRAPYAGRVEKKMADVGQFVTTGTLLAQIFAVDYAEVPMPIPNADLAYLGLPESYRDGGTEQPQTHPEVLLTVEIGGKEATWKGRIIRVSGVFDERSRQLYAVAQVEDPYAKKSDGSPPLKPGAFVKAEIKGKAIPNVFVIPRTAVRASDEVIIIDDQSRMWRRAVTPVWRDEDSVVVMAGKTANAGLEEGELLCTTPIAFPVHGAPVIATIDGQQLEKGALADKGAGKPTPPKAGKPSNT